MKNSPTLKDIGKLAGVTAATVSMALRGNARISPATQKRVRQAAKKLNYRPDPILSALVTRRRGVRPRKTFANLAILIDERWLLQGKTPLWMQSFLQGTARMGNRLGYHIDVLFYPCDLVLGKNADRILHARGIQGVALFPLPGEQKNLSLDWDRYALVVVGHPKLHQMLHRVGSDPFAAMDLICRKLREYGYQRIGLAHSLHQETELRYEFLGAYIKENYLYKKTFRTVPPHIPKLLTKDHLLTWIHKHDPECVITTEEVILQWLSETNLKVPEDIGIAFLNTHIIKTPNVAGTLLHNDVTGENAIELLHDQLLHGETGFPKIIKELLTYPLWREGNTIRKQVKETG